MKNRVFGPYGRPPYIPASLSEIVDLLTSMIGGAPNFTNRQDIFPEMDLELEFYRLTEAFGKSRKRLGEELYAKLIEMTAQMKQFFLDDPEDNNGKTMEGIRLIHQMTDLIDDVRARRVKAKQKDEEGRVTGD